LKILKIYSVFFLLSFFLLQCSNSTEPTTNSSGNSPSSHTVNKNGVFHKTGLTNPLTNCIECHGSDLRGGSVGVSCYSCHGQKWQ
jgi:hypothetical protein